MRRLLLIVSLLLFALAPAVHAADNPPTDDGGSGQGQGQGHDCEGKKEPATS